MKYTLDNTVRAGKRAIVFLNGEEVRYVVEADDDEGYVVVVNMNAVGEDGTILHDTLHGDVRVEVSPA